MYVYGGLSALNENYQTLADLWICDRASNQWTWLSGSRVSIVPDTCGYVLTDHPEHRFGVFAQIIKETGDLYLFGGQRRDGGNCGFYSDLWTWSRKEN
jgi:hypothetical protein